MATLKALKALGSSIVADITDAKDSVKAAYRRQRTERQVIKDFRAVLREDPKAVLKAFAAMQEQPAPKKPRASRKPAAAE